MTPFIVLIQQYVPESRIQGQVARSGKLIVFTVWFLAATVLGMAYRSNLLSILVTKRFSLL